MMKMEVSQRSAQAPGSTSSASHVAARRTTRRPRPIAISDRKSLRRCFQSSSRRPVKLTRTMIWWRTCLSSRFLRKGSPLLSDEIAESQYALFTPSLFNALSKLRRSLSLISVRPHLSSRAIAGLSFLNMSRSTKCPVTGTCLRASTSHRGSSPVKRRRW